MSEVPERVARALVPEMDSILGIPFQVLDGGFVRAIDYMGDDSSVVQAARVSYGAGTKTTREDRALIRYLMRHFHTTPFEMCELKLHLRVPMDVWRQWIRHRTASVNEYSTRYSIAIDSAHGTAPSEWRLQSGANRQGSAGGISLDVGNRLSEGERKLHRAARDIYEERLAAGVAREQARKDLPLATYTEAYWKIDLHNLLHFLRLRMDDQAQEEIRKYAEVIGKEIVARWCPLVWEAFSEYRVNGVALSKTEAGIAKLIVEGKLEDAKALARSAGLLIEKGGRLEGTREWRESADKLKSLGLATEWLDPPW